VGYVFLCSMTLALICSMLPLITRAIQGLPVMGGVRWNDYFISCAIILSTIFNVWTNFGYLFGGVVDFSRRRHLQAQLSNLISRGYEPSFSCLKKAPDSSPEAPPQLLPQQYFREKGPLIFDLSVPENIISWWSSRQVIQDFGLNFYKRVNGYTAAFIFFAALIIASLYYVVFTNTTLISFVIYVVAGYTFVALLFIISFLVIFGGRANRIRKEQALIFLQRRAILETVVLDSIATDHIKKQLQLSIDLLGSVAKLVEIDNQVRNITILGFEAGSQFARSLIALALAGLGVFLRDFV